jgi:hypothetical protein
MFFLWCFACCPRRCVRVEYIPYVCVCMLKFQHHPLSNLHHHLHQNSIIFTNTTTSSTHHHHPNIIDPPPPTHTGVRLVRQVLHGKLGRLPTGSTDDDRQEEPEHDVDARGMAVAPRVEQTCVVVGVGVCVCLCVSVCVCVFACVCVYINVCVFVFMCVRV